MKRHCKRQDGSLGVMDEIGIELLSLKHDTAAFDCGKLALNAFIQKHAVLNLERGVSRVYVATRAGASQVLGYYAASAGTFRREHLPPDDQTGLPGYPLPTVHLGRLAVDLSYRGKRLGETLLFHFLSVAVDVAERIGVFGVDLFAKDDEAKRFYLKYGFIPLQDNPFHFYVPMGPIRAMFE
jgi:GNAT superfamily N-acetyltransferase